MKIELVLKINGEEVMKVAEVEHEIEVKDNYDQYTRYFDETNPNWEKDAEYNKMFLLQKQHYLNEKLKQQGYLFLNDAYDELGFTRSKEGQLVGWLYNADKPSRINFGLFTNKRANDFINGFERNVMITFNVDGNIWNEIES